MIKQIEGIVGYCKLSLDRMISNSAYGLVRYHLPRDNLQYPTLPYSITLNYLYVLSCVGIRTFIPWTFTPGKLPPPPPPRTFTPLDKCPPWTYTPGHTQSGHRTYSICAMENDAECHRLINKYNGLNYKKILDLY